MLGLMLIALLLAQAQSSGSQPGSSANSPLLTPIARVVPGFGASVLEIGDVDRDGVSEIAISGCTKLGFGGRHSSLHVYSGKTGSVLRSRSAESSTSVGRDVGYSLCRVQDVDKDGVGDLAVGRPSQEQGYAIAGAAKASTERGRVDIVSSRSLELLRRIEAPPEVVAFGLSLLLVDDWTGDGVADLAIGARGSVFVYDTEAWQQLARADSPSKTAPPGSLGASLWAVGDVDGDGLRELCMGAPDPASVDMQDRALAHGYVELMSSRSREWAKWFRVPSDDAWWNHGYCGLWNPQLADTVFVSAYDWGVLLVSRTSGAVLARIADPAHAATGVGNPRGFGDSLALVADVDGDQIDDVCVGCQEDAGDGDYYLLTVLSGKSGAVWKHIDLGEQWARVWPCFDGAGKPAREVLLSCWKTGNVVKYSVSTAAIVQRYSPCEPAR